LAYFKSVIGSRGDTQLIESVAAVDPRVSWSDPIVGEWWIDTSKCYYDRPRPIAPDPEGWTPLNRGGVRPTSGAGGINVGKWIYAPEGEGVRCLYYFGNGPDSTAAHMMEFFSTWDGVPWADPHSTLFSGQLIQVWRLDPHLIVRLVVDNKSPVYERWEWAVWAPSTDGRMFACTSWDSPEPDRHNLQVFDKHFGPTYDSRGTGAPVAAAVVAGAPTPLHDTDPVLGTWVIDPEKSSFLRRGQNVPEVRPAVVPYQKWRFEREGNGVWQKHFDTPGSDAAAISFFYRFDGGEYPAPYGPGRNESVAYWKMGSEVIIRRVRTFGVAWEWSIYAFSSDGRIMSVTSWDEKTPYNRDIHVFHKVAGRTAPT
jgi:hypothetical protein